MMQQAEAQPQPRPPRTPPAGSCTECRRRKQKCDKGQPCSNCKRRFPEPECVYLTAKKSSKRRPLIRLASSQVPAQLAGPAPYTRKVPIPRSPKARPRQRPVLLAKWSGVNLTTEYPVYQVDADHDTTVWETIEEPGPTPQPTETPKKPPKPSKRSAQTTTTSASLAISKLLNGKGGGNVWQFTSPVDGMTALPIPATKQNALLVHTFAKLLHHFKGSFDGDPDPDNPFVKDYVPWCIQSPLLAHTSLYISARSLMERQYIDQTSSMRMKGHAIHTLNTHLQSENWASDEALAGVVQFVSIEWFFGEPEVVIAHLRGLREMVRLRGGFTQVGVGALVTKVALVDDAVVAMSLETDPTLRPAESSFQFDYREPPLEHFRLRFSSPFLPGSFVFASRARAMGIHPRTASILDDMQFLISAVLSLTESPSAQGLKKVELSAVWIHERISKLPKDIGEEAVEVVRVDEEVVTAAAETSSGLHAPPPDDDEAAEGKSTLKPHSLLPQYPDFVSSPSSTAGSTAAGGDTPASSPPNYPDNDSPPTNNPTSSSSQSPHSPPPTEQTIPDPLYTAVRLAAPLYARAIGTRQPFSAVCTPADALSVLAATWRIPLARWRGVIGVLLFTLISIVSTTSSSAAPENGMDAVLAAQLRPHSGFVKSILQIGFMQISLENWEVCRESMGRVMKLLEWLRGGSGAGGKGRTGEGTSKEKGKGKVD